ncbi:MAG: hypothetical protein IJN72_10455 [Firmicutes bacterium]|nr:hypothetical protein [Bacillota bacterium]
MKKYISVMLVMLLALSLAACGTDESSVTEPPEPTGENPAVQTGQESPEQAEKEAANLREEFMEGCWTATDEQFAYFTWKDGKAAFYGGTWEDENVIDKGAGLIIDFDQEKDTCNIKAAWQEDGEVQEIVLDIAGIEQDGKVNITFEGETRTYALGGPTYDDAYDSVHDVQYAGYEEIRRAWEPLLGRWTAAGDRIIDFAYNGNGDPTITISQGENTGKTGTFEKAMSPLTYELGQWNKLIFSYEKPIEFREIYLDLSGLDRDGSINLKQEADGDVYQLGRDDFY